MVVGDPGDPQDPVNWLRWALLVSHVLAAELPATDSFSLRRLPTITVMFTVCRCHSGELSQGNGVLRHYLAVVQLAR